MIIGRSYHLLLGFLTIVTTKCVAASVDLPNHLDEMSDMETTSKERRDNEEDERPPPKEEDKLEKDDRMTLTKKQIKQWKKPKIRNVETSEWKMENGNLIQSNDLFKKKEKSCCTARRPSCCNEGTEMLWRLGVKNQYTIPGAVAQQPTVYNPKCFNSVDFDTIPNADGQPFCHEFTIGNAINMKSASLEAIIYSLPPRCSDTTRDRFCLTTATGKEWCTMLQPGANKFCLDLDELGLIDDGSMDTLLARTAYYSSVDFLRLHVIFCENVVVVPPVTNSASMYFEFNNNLDSEIAGVPSFTTVGGTSSYFENGPRGTAVVFPETPDLHLEMPTHVSQQGGSAMTMAMWVYFDEAPDLDIFGAGTLMTLVKKYGSYQWMMTPGYYWSNMHVHLGPGWGTLVFAQPNLDLPDFQIPIQKWLCMVVTIEADTVADTTTVKFYLNGKLWGPPTIVTQAFNMDGIDPLLINNNNFGDGNNWVGKVDTFALWKEALHPKDVSRFCKCNEDD